MNIRDGLEGYFLPTSKKKFEQKYVGGRVVRYGFGNLFDFDYLIKYLRRVVRNIFTHYSRNKVTTNLCVSLYTSKLMSIVDT